MKIVTLASAPPYSTEKLVAAALLDGTTCNVRVIRLTPGQSVPPHTHGASDLMLFVVEGSGVLDTADGTETITAGTLAHLRGDEELRVTNDGDTGLTLLAFLAPPFPPAG
jgi:quercetin dioxygenase-like cupin family protein